LSQQNCYTKSENFNYNIQIVYSNGRLKYFNAHRDMYYNVLKSLLAQIITETLQKIIAEIAIKIPIIIFQEGFC